MPLNQSLALDVGNWLPPGCVLHTRIPHCRRIHWREWLPYSFFSVLLECVPKYARRCEMVEGK